MKYSLANIQVYLSFDRKHVSHPPIDCVRFAFVDRFWKENKIPFSTYPPSVEIISSAVQKSKTKKEKRKGNFVDASELL